MAEHLQNPGTSVVYPPIPSPLPRPKSNPDMIDTTPFADKIRLRSLWPPGESWCRLLLAVVPAAVVPGLAERLGLGEDELYLDDYDPVVVLGEALIGTDEKYAALPSYDLAEARRLTQMFRAPQLAKEKAQRAAAERLAELERERAAKASAWQEAEAQRLDAERRKSPAWIRAELERRLAALEAAKAT